MRLFRFLGTVVFLAAIVYFATTVQLGKKTLWGHLVAIFSTPAAKELADGTKEEAKKVAERVRRELGHHDGGTN